MVTVGDAVSSVYQGLRSMPRRVYLLTMWILGGELRDLYEPWTRADEVPLMTATMDLVREVVICGETGDTAQRAWELADAWARVMSTREAEVYAPGGLLNALATYQALAQEIAGLSGLHDAANWLTNAAEERWRDWDRPGPIIVNWEDAEELVESSPMGQTLAVFDRVVTRVSGLVSPEWDPVRIRAEIFRERWSYPSSY